MQLHKELKTMEMSEAWFDTYDEGYIHQLQAEPHTKLGSGSRITEFKDILPWKISQMTMKTMPISTKISHKLCNETGYPVLSLTESQWKLSNMIWFCQWRKSQCRTNTSIRKINPKEQGRTFENFLKILLAKMYSLQLQINSFCS